MSLANYTSMGMLRHLVLYDHDIFLIYNVHLRLPQQTRTPTLAAVCCPAMCRFQHAAGHALSALKADSSRAACACLYSTTQELPTGHRWHCGTGQSVHDNAATARVCFEQHRWISGSGLSSCAALQLQRVPTRNFLRGRPAWGLGLEFHAAVCCSLLQSAETVCSQRAKHSHP